jgi:hypothetical protein
MDKGPAFPFRNFKRYSSPCPKKNGLMVTFDDKSGYDHVKISEFSYTYFGIQFSGYFMTYPTLPFGWKGSACIRQLSCVSTSIYGLLVF